MVINAFLIFFKWVALLLEQINVFDDQMLQCIFSSGGRAAHLFSLSVVLVLCSFVLK